MLDDRKSVRTRPNAFLDVLMRRKPQRRPVWFMRQAGRYLPEYRAVRERAGSFLDLCYNPELAAEVTIQPLRRFDIDAAILFADILVVPHAMGLPLRFEEGEGPILGTVRNDAEVLALRPVSSSQEVVQVCRTVTLTRSLLDPATALIGFCGGPWTVASYMVAGGSSDRVLAKIPALRREGWFVALIEMLVRESVEYLVAQAEAGADALQIFDSWAGDLFGQELSDFVLGPIGKIVSGVHMRVPDIPSIVFARGIGMKHGLVADLPGVGAIGVESELDLGLLPDMGVIQGNLDPVALLAGADVAIREAGKICELMPKERHIFNLGHGIRVGTMPEVVGSVVDAVRRADGR